MGKIISSKRNGNKIIFEVETSQHEACHLQGQYDDIVMFSDNNSGMSSHVSSRGKNSSTKYFLIPKDLRRQINIKSTVNCQSIESGNKVLLLYCIEKDGRTV